MDLTHLIEHPEEMDKESLYALRELLARHPYYQTARLLMLQNLYLLHDPTFDEELRRSAIYITDRNVLFQLVEAKHYKLKADTSQPVESNDTDNNDDRTSTLIDNFLKKIPEDKEQEQHKKRKPTLADATIDYVAYLMDLEDEEKEKEESKQEAPTMKGQSLIDNFINVDKGNFNLKDKPEYLPEVEADSPDEDEDEGFFTETLARIYIKQGRYSKALEIIQRLNLDYPKKNRYFADQIRFLEKLVQNERAK